jgi:hypothetical protein
MTDESLGAGTPAQRREIRSLLEEGATADDLAAQLDFSLLTHGDSYADWHPSTPMEPMVRLHYLRCLYNWSFAEAARYIDTAEARDSLGFYESRSRSTVSRAWNNRFTDDLRFTIQRYAEATVQIAEEMGDPLAIELAEPQRDGKSEPTEFRLVQDCLERIPPTVMRLVKTDMNFIPARADNAQYQLSQFLDIESRIGLLNGAIEDGCKQYRISNDGEGPGGDIFRHYLKENSVDDLLRRFGQTNQTIAGAAKQRLDFSRPVTVAIDFTPIPYYGERRDEYVFGAKPGRRFSYQQEFAVASVVTEDVRLVLTFRRRRKGETVGEITRDLLNTASDIVNIRRVFADREFATAEVVDELESKGVKYVIPVPSNDRIRRAIQNMSHDVEVKEGYGLYGPTRDGPTNDRVETTLALIPSTKQYDNSEQGTVPFYTNEDIDDYDALRREWAERKLNKYRYRWGVETGFKSIKQFLPVTASNDDRIRVFHFGFAVVLANLWRLIDYLVRKETRDEIDYGESPLVTARQFRESLHSGSGFV